MTTAFILDPIEGADHLTAFTNKARELHGWTFVRLILSDSQADPWYFKQILTAVESADVILCFGNYFWFMYCQNIPEFSKLIDQKLNSGTPFFLEFVRAAEGLQRDQIHSSVGQFLRRLGVIATQNRIFSDLDAHLDHMSGGSCWFRSEDGCLINPQILGGVDKILLTHANELQHFEDVFPVVQIGPSHYLVDERDLVLNRQLGYRSSVAVERRTETEFALVFAGDIARDTRQTFGGLLHGFAENEKVVTKVIDHLARSIDSEEKRSLIAYEKLSRLERRLGELISEVLRRHLGNENIYNAFPGQVLENIRKGEGHDYSQANYRDLLNIVWYNWEDAFSPLFDISRTQLKKTLERINYGLRRYLAHPHKANRHRYQFQQEEVAAVETGLALIGLAKDRLKQIDL
jgi:hypothetical protein